MIEDPDIVWIYLVKSCVDCVDGTIDVGFCHLSDGERHTGRSDVTENRLIAL